MKLSTRRLGRRIGRGAVVAAVATGVTLAGTPAFAGSAEDWKIVAHRGGMANGVQHSLAQLTEMLRLKADAAEVDVVMTRDRVPVIFHDNDDLAILTTNCSGLVSQHTIEQIDRCILRNKFGDPKFDNQHILTLNSALKLIDKGADRDFQVFLHVKNVSKDHAKKIANVAERYDVETIPISNSKTMLGYLKKRGLKKQGLVFNTPSGWSTNYKFLIPYNVTTNSSYIKAAHKRGQRVFPVENAPHTLLDLNAVDVDGVLVNNLTGALLLAGRLDEVLVQSEDRKQERRVPATGPSRTTGPMDF